jgi:hypothetical protein
MIHPNNTCVVLKFQSLYNENCYIFQRETLTDFDRFKLMKAKQAVSKIFQYNYLLIKLSNLEISVKSRLNSRIS